MRPPMTPSRTSIANGKPITTRTINGRRTGSARHELASSPVRIALRKGHGDQAFLRNQPAPVSAPSSAREVIFAVSPLVVLAFPERRLALAWNFLCLIRPAGHIVLVTAPPERRGVADYP